MKSFITSLLGRAADLARTQPLIALCLGGALLALFLHAWMRHAPHGPRESSMAWTIYRQFGRAILAISLVLLLLQSFAVLRTHLRRSVAQFEQTHGRVTEANYNAVQTIWGAEQTQRELAFQVYYEEEITERTEFEDPAKPAIIRKKTVRRNVVGNPFVSASHQVTLRQNPRKKGSALYGGYETSCKFTWKLKSPADRSTKGLLRFPLPAQGAMYDELTATLNGQDVLPRTELSDAALVLARDLAPGEELDFAISFKSRGMSQWYFQVQEQREIRDFTLALTLPDLPRARLNYPEGCMSPSEIAATGDGRGSVLNYRLDHAISHKGMGIALPTLPQPGAATCAVLNEAERGWMLMVALLLLAATLQQVRHGPLFVVLMAVAMALAFAFLGDFSDLLFGFWGTAALVFAPLVLFLCWLARLLIGGLTGGGAAVLLAIFGIIYPAAAGLDPDRQNLYLHLCVFAFLAFATWILTAKWKAAA